MAQVINIDQISVNSVAFVDINVNDKCDEYWLTGTKTLDNNFNVYFDMGGLDPETSVRIVIRNKAIFTGAFVIRLVGTSLPAYCNNKRWKADCTWDKIKQGWDVEIYMDFTDDDIPFIPYSSLILTNSIVNDDINTDAAIGITKLAAMTAEKALATDELGRIIPVITSKDQLNFLKGVVDDVQTQLDAKPNSGNITETDLSPDCRIPYGKLNIEGAVSNDDLAGGIGYNKLNLSDSIRNNDIYSGASIAVSKLAGIGGNKGVVTDVNGKLVAATATDTEVNYVVGLGNSVSGAIGELKAQVDPNTITKTNGTYNLSALGDTRNFLCNSSAGDVIIYLPPVNDCQKEEVNFSCVDGTNSVKIYPYAGDAINIDGSEVPYVEIGTTGTKLRLRNNGTLTWNNF